MSVYLKENLMLFPAVILRIPRRAVWSKDFLFIWKYVSAYFSLSEIDCFTLYKLCNYTIVKYEIYFVKTERHI